ncbi:MAG: transketolase, partial [Candidatus Aenigmarchaeota archaeon]|nr:transketolase [Candidatus Aenigmarchaeota archaeon]MDI6722614.1 transketolase [Candidatus Aenigmarchaeota archaeon]
MDRNVFDITKDIRKSVLGMCYKSKSSHVGTALSCVDLLTVLYFKTMNVDSRKPEMKERDRFILSKGHGACALYATLSHRGFFPLAKLEDFYSNGSKLAGHPSLNCVPGVEATTGSLGHGLPIACGMAFSGRYDKTKYRVFVLMSDGECDEGSVWEAVMFAGFHKLDNLTVIIDYNKIQSFGRTKEVLDLEP